MSEPARLSIPVDEIYVPDDYLRPVDATAVDALARLIKSEGQKSPIAVYQSIAKNGGTTPYTLIYGARRLAAIKALGHSDIEAILRTKAEALMLAVADNFAMPTLDALEQGEHVARFAAWWIEENGQIAHGGDRKSKFHRETLIRDQNKLEKSGFYKDLSEKLGLSKSTGWRLLRIGNLHPDLRAVLRGTGHAKDQKQLKKLTKFGSAEQAGIAAAFRAHPDLDAVLRLDDPATGRKGVGRLPTGDWREQRFREAWEELPRDRRAAALDGIGAMPKLIEAWPSGLPRVQAIPAPGNNSPLWAMLRDPYTHLSRKLSYTQIMAAKKAYEEDEAAIRRYEEQIAEQEAARREEFNAQQEKARKAKASSPRGKPKRGRPADPPAVKFRKKLERKGVISDLADRLVTIFKADETFWIAKEAHKLTEDEQRDMVHWIDNGDDLDTASWRVMRMLERREEATEPA